MAASYVGESTRFGSPLLAAFWAALLGCRAAARGSQQLLEKTLAGKFLHYDRETDRPSPGRTQGRYHPTRLRRESEMVVTHCRVS